MKDLLPENLIQLANSCPFKLYVVGGACRDYLAGFKSHIIDWDICAPASAEELVAIAQKQGFFVSAVFKNTGTVKLSKDGDFYEFTSFRTDEYVRGVHNPVNIYFTDDITCDARRRDFKCNAVYYDIVGGQFCDPLGGIDDIKNKVMTTVAPSHKVFGEDGLRLMRLCRQSAQLGFNPTEECKDGARRNRHLIEDISVERIWAELQLILTADTRYGVQYAQYNGLKLMHDIGVLDILIPELTLGDGMAQRADYHNHDVLEHSLRCVMYAPSSIRLAALLHDVGKPKVKKDTGKYFGHEIVGAQIASGICARLHVPKHIQEQTVWLTANHMYDLDCKTKESKVRKFIVKNLPYFDDIIAIKQADYSACKDDLSPAPCVERWLNVYKTMEQEGAPFKLSQLKVRGDELIGAGIPHEYIGKTLNFLLETCALEPTLNIPQTLIKLALGHYREISSN